jgi:Xaa-Pro aminopeptidase
MINEKVKQWFPEHISRQLRFHEHEISGGEQLPRELYKTRMDRALKEIEKSEYDAYIVYGDCYRMSNIRWLVDYRTIDGVYPQPELLYLVPGRDPVLFLPMSEIPSAHVASAMKLMGDDIREIRSDWEPFLKERAAKDKPKKIGISGYRYMDLEFYPPMVRAFGETALHQAMIIEQLKSVKTEAELNLMFRAARVCNAAIETLIEVLRLNEGITEREANSLCYSAMFAKGGSSIAFDTMVQAGDNTNVLFRHPTDRPIRRGELVLMDYGIRVNGYASDNARTVCYGNVSAEQRQLMEACSRVYEAGLGEIRAGMTGIEADAVLRRLFKKEGVEQYLVAPSEGRTGAHATGMDPEEDIPEIGNKVTNVLEENQTFAFELSLIKPGVGGVRTEDQVVVRKGGIEPFHTFNRFLYVD